MVDSRSLRSGGDSGFKPHWGTKVMDAAANFAAALDPVTGSLMKVVSVTAQYLDKKCHEEARRQRS